MKTFVTRKFSLAHLPKRAGMTAVAGLLALGAVAASDRVAAAAETGVKAVPLHVVESWQISDASSDRDSRSYGDEEDPRDLQAPGMEGDRGKDNAIPPAFPETVPQRNERSSQDMRGKTVQQVAAMSSKELVGKTVFNTEDDALGEIKQVVVDGEGAIEEVVLKVGGFLGIGGKLVALPPETITLGKNGKLVARLTEDDLERRPEFSPER